MPPSKHVAVVACMDARLDVYRLLGLKNGEAHVIRNAGGVVTDDMFKRDSPQTRPGRPFLRSDS
jgi:carbonic anhydrase